MSPIHIEEHLSKGIEIGIAQGVKRGLVRGKQETIVRQLRLKFGNVPATLLSRIESISDKRKLDALADRIISANSLDEMMPT